MTLLIGAAKVRQSCVWSYSKTQVQVQEQTYWPTGSNWQRICADVITDIVAYVVPSAGAQNSTHARLAREVKWCDVFSHLFFH
jgi:hypothetical protein